jgi:hypothetical protein
MLHVKHFGTIGQHHATWKQDLAQFDRKLAELAKR